MPSAKQIEQIKREGVGLNLTEVAQRGYRAIASDDLYRLKFQGVCTQRNPAEDGRIFLRIKVPFGQVSAAQLRGLGHLAEEQGRGWGHLTTRQGIELHAVRLEDVPSIFDTLSEIGLTTKAACGDTIRNVVTCPHAGSTPGTAGGPLFDVRPWALLIQNHFLSLDLDTLNLPRKMNVYVTGCAECIGHARINDLGLVGMTRRRADGTRERGFGLWVGGGLGANPRLGQQLRSFLPFDDVLPALEAVVRLYMDHGSRVSRATSKLKFLLEDWGMGRFSHTFESYYAEIRPHFQSRALSHTASLSRSVRLPRPTENHTYQVNVLVPEGEIRSDELLSLADMCTLFGEGYLFFTKEQNVRFINLSAADAAKLTAALHDAGFQTEGAGQIDDVLACPGTAFCPVAATPSLLASQRIRKALQERIAAGFLPPDVQDLRIHISGCPNSCAQHQVADIGLAGTRVHAPDEKYSGLGYQLFLGGTLEGPGQLALLVHHGIPEERLEDVLIAILTAYTQQRQPTEGFSAYIGRIGQSCWEERITGVIQS